MAFYTINTSNTSFLSSSESLVYAGKNGFTTAIGSIPVLCTSVLSNTDYILMTVDNMSLLFDDNYQMHVLDVPNFVGQSNTFIRIPISQYSESSSAQGSSGYYSNLSNLSAEITSYNVASNSITIANKSISSGLLSDLLLTAPFYLNIFQTVGSDNVTANSLYVSGSSKSFTHRANVVGLTSYVMPLKKAPKSRNFIRAYVDDTLVDSYNWSSAEPLIVTLPSFTNGNQLTVIVDDYTVPAIEANDIVSLSVFNNTYSIVSTSYQTGSVQYDGSLTDSNIYKITLDKPLPANILSYYLINVSDDLEGVVSNITSNSFTIDYEDSYPYSYSLANAGIYYLFQKNKVNYTTAKLDEYGRLYGLSPRDYLIEATTINRYNRASFTIRGLLQVEGVKLSRVSEATITERVFIDTTGGASISATIEFLPITDRDVAEYEILYRVVSVGESTVPQYTRVIINNDSDVIRYTINNLNRGPVAASNTLDVIITPLNGIFRGYSLFKSHSLLGKLTSPAGLSDFNVTQQGDSIIYTWQFAQTADGYILDLDTKEVEIREYLGTINIADEETVNAAWAISLVVDRIPFPNTTYTTPIAKYGAATYFIRVRDTSNNESNKINADIITLERSISRIYKAYNESNPSTSFVSQDGVAFPNSNTYPEVNFPSFNDSLYNGFVYADSTNVDNANGSSSGFSVDVNDPFAISTTNQPYAEYTTQIRDVGKIIRGSIRIKPVISISTATTYNDVYRMLQSGISDYHESDGISVDPSILVDNAFGGVGYVLGFNNANAASATYNSYAKTLTSGGAAGNVFAIRNPGQFVGDVANANMFALIAGVISENSIQLGEVFYSNGKSTGQNVFSNLTISGNAYELVDLAQYLDTAGSLTYLGPTRDIVQNIYLRYSTDNVYYTASANGVVGFPGHGNTNPNAFSGASTNASLSLKRYLSGDIDFRYFQIRLEYTNKEPTVTSVVLDDFTYEVDVQEKTFTAVKQVSSVNGEYIDFSFKNYIEPPKITASMYNILGAFTVNISNVSSIGCNVAVYQANSGLAVSGYNVSVTAIGI
jgi:hypothetical protein